MNESIGTDELLNPGVCELLEKLGAGNSTPGSGSIAALTGIIAAEALLSVIKLTDRVEYRERYENSLPTLLKQKWEIESNIIPELMLLFQLDTDKFKDFNDLRIRRDKAVDRRTKLELAGAVKMANIPIVEIPLKIATLCMTIVEYSNFAFDNGFKSVRGESSVAINNSISAVNSCISIIYLNLNACENSEWKRDVKEKTNRLRVRNEILSQIPLNQIEILEKESDTSDAFREAIGNLRSNYWASSTMSDKDIENLARQVQNTIWTYKRRIWKQNEPQNLQDILDPQIALEKIMGYNVTLVNSLGTNFLNGVEFKVAGIIDKENKVIELSDEFSLETMKFTAAHELGHALLHMQTELHRDRPIDGSLRGRRNKQEYQADKFAAFFLMPRTLVTGFFKEMFGSDKITINQNTVFGLTDSAKVVDFRRDCEDAFGFSCFIASAESYRGMHFQSLASLFGVSVKTMAIQLLELGLVEF